MTTPDQARAIAAGLSEAQKRSLKNPHWLHPGGMAPICLVEVTSDPWPQGVAQFFTLKTDRLTPLGQSVRAILQEQSNAD